jgi:hypothetical protein
MTKRELESALELRCVAKVEAIGGKALKLRLEGVRGFPDRTVLLHARNPPPIKPGEWRDTSQHDGQVFFAEFKRMQVGVISAQQSKWRFMLNLLGFEVYMVDTDEQFGAILEEWK